MESEDEKHLSSLHTTLDLGRRYNERLSFEQLHVIAHKRGVSPHQMRDFSDLLGRDERYRDDPDSNSITEKSQSVTESNFVSGGEKGYTDHDMEKEYSLPSYSSRVHHKPSRLRRPLIDLVRNEWRTNPKYGQLYSPASDDGPWSPHDPPSWSQVLTARKFRRFLSAVLLVLFMMWINWTWWMRSRWEENVSLRGALDERMRTGQGWFGANMQPVFTDMVQIRTLDAGLVPRAGKERRNRLMIVGDVHGSKDERMSLLSIISRKNPSLKQDYRSGHRANAFVTVVSLLAKVSFHPEHDHLVLTGDLISKGPDSPGVIDLALSMNASCVRGNHEDRVLLAHRDMHTRHLSLPGPHEDVESKGALDLLDEESFSHGDYVDRKLAASLSQKQINYLAACPVILRVGEIQGLGQVSVVHAGLIPGVDLERQDPLAVMTMRTVDLKTHVPSRTADGVPWSKVSVRENPI